jgi:hypothetical protein
VYSSKSLSLTPALLALLCGCANPPHPFDDVTSVPKRESTMPEPLLSPRRQHLALTDPSLPPSKRIVPPERVRVAQVQDQLTITTLAGDEEQEELPPATPHMDAAGQLRRDWPMEIAFRPSGNSLSGPVYYKPVFPRQSRPEWTQIFIEPAEFAFNTLLLPARIVDRYPWKLNTDSPVGEPGWRVYEQSGFLFSEQIEDDDQ